MFLVPEIKKKAGGRETYLFFLRVLIKYLLITRHIRHIINSDVKKHTATSNESREVNNNTVTLFIRTFFIKRPGRDKPKF